MRRVLIFMDVTEDEAERIVEALGPVSLGEGIGIKRAYEQAQAQLAPAGARGLTLRIRSRASATLGGPEYDIALDKAQTNSA